MRRVLVSGAHLWSYLYGARKMCCIEVEPPDDIFGSSESLVCGLWLIAFLLLADKEYITDEQAGTSAGSPVMMHHFFV